jgi:hypothetical protein
MTSHLRRAPLLIAVAAVSLALVATVLPAQDQSAAATSARANRESFRADMRALWEDHIVWTRQVITSFASDHPDLGPSLDRLLRNQDDIGDAIKPFYGDAAGEQLSTLLREHITGAADLLGAARSGDQAAIDEAAAAWYANGSAIADFLASANPVSWPAEHMRDMMRDHLDLTLAEASLRLQSRFAEDVAIYDQIHVQILEMADMLSDGIISQFPAQFAR